MGTNGADHHEGASAKTLADIVMADSLCVCTFTSALVLGASTDKVVTDMLNPLCGWNRKPEDFWTAAKRIMTAERVFNVREGISSKDDGLPPRMRTGEASRRAQEGRSIHRRGSEENADSTYGFFGWDAKGIPTDASLKAYGLDYLIADVNAARKKFNL